MGFCWKSMGSVTYWFFQKVLQYELLVRLGAGILHLPAIYPNNSVGVTPTPSFIIQQFRLHQWEQEHRLTGVVEYLQSVALRGVVCRLALWLVEPMLRSYHKTVHEQLAECTV